MKSDYAFTVEIRDMSQFVEEMKSAIRPETENNFYAGGDVMFDINDVSAVYPLSSHHEGQRQHNSLGGYREKYNPSSLHRH